MRIWQTGNRLLATAFQRAFPGRTLSARREDTQQPLLALPEYGVKPPVGKGAGHICM